MNKFLKNNISAFVDSFKNIDLRLVYSVLYDFIGYGLIIICFRIYQYFLEKLFVKMPSTSLLQSLDATSAQLTQTLAALKAVFFWLILYSVLLFIVILLIWCLFKGLIWNQIFNKKFTFKFYKKFLLVNLLWVVIWLIPIVLFFIFVKQNVLVYLLIIVFILMIYLSYILYIESIKQKKIKEIIKETFRIGFKKIYYFIIPGIVMVILFFILMQLYWLFKGLSQVVQAIIFLIILIVFIAWTRFYVVNVVEGISK